MNDVILTARDAFFQAQKQESKDLAHFKAPRPRSEVGFKGPVLTPRTQARVSFVNTLLYDTFERGVDDTLHGINPSGKKIEFTVDPRGRGNVLRLFSKTPAKYREILMLPTGEVTITKFRYGMPERAGFIPKGLTVQKLNRFIGENLKEFIRCKVRI